MRTRHSIIIVASVLALALATSAVVAAPAHATFPGRNGLIAFTASVANSSFQIFVMNPDGSGLRKITLNPGTDSTLPSISPDGRKIVFLYWSTAGDEIRAMTTTGADSRHLATGRCDWPSFSPDGRQVVFWCAGQIWLMNADGSHQRRLTSFRVGAGLIVNSPTFSPDGKTIVMVGLVYLGHPSAKNRYEILAMNADGTHLRRLAYSTKANYGVMVAPPAWGVSFAPGGRTIVYGAYTNGGEKIIRVMNADGSDQRLLPRSYGFTWPCYSPDGRRILCLNGHGQICVVRANGTLWRQLTHISGGVLAPDWGPHVR